jgi:hypothetical protein
LSSFARIYSWLEAGELHHLRHLSNYPTMSLPKTAGELREHLATFMTAAMAWRLLDRPFYQETSVVRKQVGSSTHAASNDARKRIAQVSNTNTRCKYRPKS